MIEPVTLTTTQKTVVGLKKQVKKDRMKWGNSDVPKLQYKVSVLFTIYTYIHMYIYIIYIYIYIYICIYILYIYLYKRTLSTGFYIQRRSSVYISVKNVFSVLHFSLTRLILERFCNNFRNLCNFKSWSENTSDMKFGTFILCNITKKDRRKCSQLQL